jgi:hypothetical protein
MFAQWVLAQAATVVRVPREADIGIDLVCTLAHPMSGAIYAGRTLGVQVKSHGKGTPHESIRFGGRDGLGRWKQHELDWLFKSDVPLFVALVNRDTGRLALYTTTELWHARWQWGRPGMITFDEKRPPGRHSKGRRMSRKPGQQKCGDGRSYIVPLGPPVFESTADEILSIRSRSRLARALETWVDLSYRNMQFHRIGVPFRETPRKWRAGRRLGGTHQVVYFNKTPRIRKSNVRSILKAIAPGVCALAQHWRDPRSRDLSALLPLVRLMRSRRLHRRFFSELLRDADEN